ncbi:MAG: response regulator [Azonexus sp.]|nr:response regulator [Azonexus sp.]
MIAAVTGFHDDSFPVRVEVGAGYVFRVIHGLHHQTGGMERPMPLALTFVHERKRFFRGVKKHSHARFSSGPALRYESSDRRKRAMYKVAIIEDDEPTSGQIRGWVLSAAPDIEATQWFTRDEAETAIAREDYDLVILDIELGRDRHAGVAIINAINKVGRGTPVLVVSAMPAAIYRGIMKALDAWDYLQKTTFEEAEFIETFLDMLRAAKNRRQNAANLANAAAAKPAGEELSIDPLRQGVPHWRGKRVNVPLTAQRILAALFERRGEVVSYDELFAVVKSGRNRENIRKHISTLREAFREHDEHFDYIENVPMRGFRWVS